MASSKKRLDVRLRTRGDAELELWAASRHAVPLAEELDVEIAFQSPLKK
jgi:hypothetical protein